jgi:hypothetical protein
MFHITQKPLSFPWALLKPQRGRQVPRKRLRKRLAKIAGSRYRAIGSRNPWGAFLFQVVLARPARRFHNSTDRVIHPNVFVDAPPNRRLMAMFA